MVSNFFPGGMPPDTPIDLHVFDLSLRVLRSPQKRLVKGNATDPIFFGYVTPNQHFGGGVTYVSALE